MEEGPVRKPLDINPKLLAYVKEVSRQTGLGVEALVNLALYELVRRFGYLTPESRSVPPPEGFDLLDQAEPAPPPPARRPPAKPVVLDKRVNRPAPVQVPRRGPPGPAPQRKAGVDVLFVQVDGENPRTVNKDVFLIGRGSKCDLVLPHRSISREHAVITREKNGWFIEDLNSANGTWLNNEQIGKHKISDGDEIHISNHLLHFGIRQG